MNKIPYANLNIKINTETTTFDFNGNQIEVLKYLPAEDKYSIITASLAGAQDENGLYNEFMLDMLFHLYIAYKYTNLVFPEDNREIEIYDCLKSSGLLDMIIDNMLSEEYDELFNMLIEMKDTRIDFNKSAAAIVKAFINDLPRNAQAAADIISKFDLKQYQAVMDFANAANGNRNIDTNEPVEKKENQTKKAPVILLKK